MASWTVYNAEGRPLTEGLQDHSARRVAQEIANNRGEPVWLGDGSEDDWGQMEQFEPQKPA